MNKINKRSTFRIHLKKTITRF